MKMQVEKIVKVYKTLAQLPSPTAVRILESCCAGDAGKVAIVSMWSQRNLERAKSVKFQQTHFVDTISNKVTEMLPVDTGTEQMAAISCSEALRCVLREAAQDGNSGSRKQFIEVWKHHHLHRTFDLSALEVHGDVYTDDEFSSLEFSPCENKILYVAEQKVLKSEPFYKPKPQESKDNGVDSSKSPQKGEEYTYRPEWGELLVRRHQPVLVVCDISTEMLTVLGGIPPTYSPGQVIWTPDGTGVVGVAWKNEPRRLGLVYCTNRSSVIFHLTLDGTFSILSSEDNAVRSPRFSPDGKSLVWLERPAGGPHHSAQRLMCCKWQSKNVKVVVDLVKQVASTSSGSPFYGLYNQRLPRRCWASDSQRVLLSTPQNCKTASFVINVESGCISELEGVGEGSGIIGDVHKDLIVIVHSCLKEPAHLALGRLAPNTKWFPITTWPKPADLAALEVHYMALQATDTTDFVRDYSAIYVGPRDQPDGSVPLIVYPHGGPHSVFTDDFSLGVALMALLGYGVLLVNYRGSTGHGNDSVYFLLGRAGDADVKDVHQAALAALDQFPCLSRKKKALFGGSHGGFLVAHLSGQYPDEYQAVVARNPVIDVAAMSGISDIPDWCYTEAGLPYNPAQVVTQEGLEAMWKCSPILHATKVKAPTLLMVGNKDLRVPHSQSLLYYHTLHANGVITKIHMYEDTHSLSKVPVEMDNVINSILWINEHLG